MGTKKADEMAAVVLAEHYEALKRYVLRMGVPPQDAEDVLQEVVLGAAQGAEDFDPTLGTLRSWLFGISTRQVLNYRRARQRCPDLLPTGQEVEEIAERAPSAEGRLGAYRRSKILDELLGEVPAERRSILIAYALLGMEMGEIAEALSLNVNTAWSRYRKARLELEEAARRWRARQRRRGHDETPGLRLPPLLFASDSEQGAGRRAVIQALGRRIGGPVLVVVAGAAGLVDAPAMPAPVGAPQPWVVTTVAEGAPAPPVSPAGEDKPAASAQPAAPPPPAAQPTTARRIPPSRRSVTQPDRQAQIRSEAKLVDRARNAMQTGQLQVARRLLEQHAREFPHGHLASSREALLRQLRGP